MITRRRLATSCLFLFSSRVELTDNLSQLLDVLPSILIGLLTNHQRKYQPFCAPNTAPKTYSAIIRSFQAVNKPHHTYNCRTNASQADDDHYLRSQTEVPDIEKELVLTTKSHTKCFARHVYPQRTCLAEHLTKSGHQRSC